MSEKEVQDIVAQAFEKQGLSEYVRKSGKKEELLPLLQNSMLYLGRILSENGYTLNEYQNGAIETAIYPEAFRVIYPALGITGEAGEVSDKIKKLVRDKGYTGGRVEDNEKAEDIVLELGDVLWYVAIMARDLGYSLSEVAKKNHDKLLKRKQTNKLGGSGDHRENLEVADCVESLCSFSIWRIMAPVTITISAAIGFILGALIF